MLKMEDLNKMDEKELATKVATIRTDIFNFKLEKTTSGLEKPHLLKVAKKELAKTLTAFNAKKAGK